MLFDNIKNVHLARSITFETAEVIHYSIASY